MKVEDCMNCNYYRHKRSQYRKTGPSDYRCMHPKTIIVRLYNVKTCPMGEAGPWRCVE